MKPHTAWFAGVVEKHLLVVRRVAGTAEEIRLRDAAMVVMMSRMRSESG